MRRAAIDIGTNTVRLLVADYHGQEHFTVISRQERITRLGGGYTPQGGIAEETMSRTIAVLQEFRAAMNDLGVESALAVATSVVRKAANRAKFIEQARSEAGIDITVITGATEAQLAARGALLPVSVPFDQALIFDIGGGSTEFILTSGTTPDLIESIELGVVHLTESLLHHDPPISDEIAVARQQVYEQVQKVRRHFEQAERFPFTCTRTVLIGIAGTPTTLAAMDLMLTVYDRDQVTNHVLHHDLIEEIFDTLIDQTSYERLLLPGLQPGREDLIIPGALITLAVMELFGFSALRVIDSGILEGIILSPELVAS